jgi:1,4-alpha-glucan branching enzyme
VLIARPWTDSGDTAGPNAFQFVLVAPQASSVAVVGDFNDWDPARSPMQTAQGVWATIVPLAPGRYRYAFLVNGVEWRADPGAPRARDDEFGTPSSVITVGGNGS